MSTPPPQPAMPDLPPGVKLLHVLQGPKGAGFWNAFFDPLGRRLVGGEKFSRESELLSWDVATGKSLGSFAKVRFSPWCSHRPVRRIHRRCRLRRQCAALESPIANPRSHSCGAPSGGMKRSFQSSGKCSRQFQRRQHGQTMGHNRQAAPFLNGATLAPRSA